MTRTSQLPAIALLALYSASVSLAPNWTGAAALLAPMVLLPLAWWLLLGANHWLAAFLCSAMLLPPLPFPIGNSGPHPALLFAFAGVGVGLLRARGWSLRFGRLGKSMLVFFAILLGSVTSAAVYFGAGIAAGSLARVLLFGVSLYVFFFTLHGPGSRPGANVLRSLRWLLGGGAAAAAFACVDFYYQFPAPAGYGAQFVWLDSGVFRRAQGLFYEASTLGNFCVFFLVLIAVFATERWTARFVPKFVLAAAGAVFVAALVLSYSRGALVALAASLGTLLLLRAGSGGIRYGIIIAPVSLLAGFASLYFFLPSFGQASWQRIVASGDFFLTDPNRLLSGRLENWSAVASLLQEHPSYLITGIGYKTLPYTELTGRPLVADNMYLCLLIETGIAGLGAFLWMNACMLIEAYRASKHLNPSAALFGTWFVCFWAGELVQMFTGDLLTYWRVLPLYLWVLACAIRHSRDADERSVC